jgi:hypothetical protein
MKFPTTPPQATNYVRPRNGETLNISPPGFCWWRAADRNACQYRLVVKCQDTLHYASPPTPDPLHIPDVVFPPGHYTWHVEALTDGDEIQATSEPLSFSIHADAIENPWTDPASLLQNVPTEHPRLFFPASELDRVRSTLSTTRAEAFDALKRAAEIGLTIDTIPEPDYDQIKDRPEQRLAYHACFQATRKVHDVGMRSLALMYLLTGERQYGDHAKTLILDATNWDVEGISSILSPIGDEVGLGLLRAGAEVYDWVYDLFTEEERARVATMVGARADQMIRQLEKSDYTYKPEGSHNGRLPGFLLEHAIALAEDPRAITWAEYALKIIGTNFPHWAGSDGGWAQGVPYGMSYNTRDANAFHAWQVATEHSVWLKPFYQGLPWFFYYCVSPIGEIMPFGDTEHAPVRPSGTRTLMHFHGLRLQDPRLRKWADQVNKEGDPTAEVDPFPGILLPDALDTNQPTEPLPNDKVFRGIGWAALHSDIAQPKDDFMIMFRSSPYGGVSHGHASQNDFAVMKGGRALICAGGERFPQHGTPFHNEYAQQSVSHNCILVNGQGAINRDGNRGGEITDFFTQDQFGYVCGEAENAYGDLLSKNRRHLLLIRPSLLVLVDDLAAPSTFQWLLHAFEKFDINTSNASLCSNRNGASLTGSVYASTALSLCQTDDWIVAPDKGFPTLTKPLPPKRWHVTAETNEQTDRCRIAAIFSVRGPGEDAPEINTQQDGDRVLFEYQANGSTCRGQISLDPNASGILMIDSGQGGFEISS